MCKPVTLQVTSLRHPSHNHTHRAFLYAGTGAVYSFDPVGSYEREACRAAGAAQSLVQPFLDNQVSSPLLQRYARPRTLTRSFPEFNPLYLCGDSPSRYTSRTRKRRPANHTRPTCRCRMFFLSSSIRLRVQQSVTSRYASFSSARRHLFYLR